LENLGIQAFQIELSETKIQGEVDSFLENSNILIIDVPPKLRGSTSDPSAAPRMTFVSKIKNVIPFIEKSSIEKILFISSTSVYGDTSTALIVTEETKTYPDTESGKQLVQAEQLLQSNPNFKTTILRFGGLIGEDRHPIHFLAGRKNIENPNAPINLIHQEDCIGIILEILRQSQNNNLVWNETFNAVTPYHPSRKEYYTQKAKDLNLVPPAFNYENPILGKTILNTKVETILGYTFTKPSL
jgi:nucleoside-diphosphate-sugar epimerase